MEWNDFTKEKNDFFITIRDAVIQFDEMQI